MKVIKPLTLGILFRPYTHRRRHRLALTALGFFPLGGRPTELLTENLQWPKVMAALPAGEMLDLAMPKPRGEVLLAGKAHAPGGNAVQRMEVRLAMGPVDKRLAITGDRHWAYGVLPMHQITAPEPFTEMPITYDRAYGGPHCPDNLSGQGHTGERLGALFGQNHGRLPNVEYPGEPATSHCARYRPAGFGPLDLRWRERQGKAGRYDAKWLANDFPGLPDDLDFSVFNAAPKDQHWPGFFQGGEAYRLEGMQPQRPVLEGSLPCLRVRAFVTRGEPEACEELALRMDTVWLLPEAEIGVCIYRGETEVEDSDALDVNAVLLGYEHQDDTPRPLAHYREVFALRLDPQTAPLHAFNESQLTPALNEQVRAQREREAAEETAREHARVQAATDAAMAEVNARLPTPLQAQAVTAAAPAAPLTPIPSAALRRGDVDLGPLITQARELAARAKADGEARLAEARARLDAVQQAPDPAAEKQAAEKRARATTVDLPPLPADVEPDRRAAIEAAQQQLPALQRKARQHAPAATMPPLSVEAAQHLGALVRRWYESGESLAGRDLSGAALAGMDFKGADLRETLFESADLHGASFAGADLRGAVFLNADLTAADFSGAFLHGANLCQVRAPKARFRDARLPGARALDGQFAGADFAGADLKDWLAVRALLDGARFDGCDLSGAFLIEAHAQDAVFTGARLDRCQAYAAFLRGADFSAVRAERAVFTNAVLQASRWQKSHLRRVHLGHQADLTGADFTGADLSHCGFRGADLSGACLRDGRFVECDFGDSRLDGAHLERAVLARSVLAGASLRGCRGEALDLFAALCRKCDFTHADLRGANLYQTILMEAVLEGTRLADVRHSRQREVAA